MIQLRFTTLTTLLASATLLAACNTAPKMPMEMGSSTTHNMTAPSHMAKMDAHMKTMHGMHEKMMKAKTTEEHNALMAEHMKVMQDGMAMMEGMAGMGGMQGKSAMSSDMPMHHQMMEKRMEMMKSMMQMMQDRMPAAPSK